MPQFVWEGYASGWIVNVAIGFTLLELVVLWVWHRTTGRGLAPRDYALNLLSGLMLMLALRASIAALWPGVALCLIAAGVAHVSDLVLRSRRKALP
ncbi:hypothetical protein [Rhodoferax sp.]|uniref:hypothetical protein n=1 Tax=Rhodoferax sp. TaxID=50421 RepID=UPI003782EACC